MKIQNTPAAAMARDWPKANKTEKGATSTPVQAEVSTETTSSTGRPSAPPGLERVVAKFEAMAAAGKMPGQGQALDRVSRNLARYQENQALAGPAPAPTPEASPVADAETPIAEAAATETPVSETPATETPVAEAPAELPPDTAEDSTVDALLDSAATTPDPATSDADTPSA